MKFECFVHDLPQVTTAWVVSNPVNGRHPTGIFDTETENVR